MSEEVKAKVKAIFPEDVEGIYISKKDYDRLYGDLTLENIELKQEIERLNKELEFEKSIKKEVREYTKSHFKEMVADEEAQKLLEILDKENKNEVVSLEELESYEPQNEYEQMEQDYLWKD